MIHRIFGNVDLQCLENRVGAIGDADRSGRLASARTDGNKMITDSSEATKWRQIVRFDRSDRAVLLIVCMLVVE